MSRPLYDFLSESLLFDEAILAEDYRIVSSEDLERELSRYCEHARRVAAEILALAQNMTPNVAAFLGGHQNVLPEETVLKQLALYMQGVVVSDPLYDHSRFPSDVERAATQVLGLNERSIDKPALAKAARYMKSLTPAVAANFLHFLPLGYFHAPHDVIPLRFSPDGFASALPRELMAWFRQRARVRPLRHEGGKWFYVEADELKPCRGIYIEFDDHPSERSAIYFLFESRVVDLDEERRIARMVQTLPETPPTAEMFDAWVNQSLNSTALGVFDEVVTDAYWASRINYYYLTTSPFVAGLLDKVLDPRSRNLKADVAKLSLSLELPVARDVSIETLMKVRTEEGESFANFRVALEKYLRELRGIDDPDTLRQRLDSIAHEFEEVQVRDVRNSLSKLRRTLLADAALFAASLGITIQNYGVGVLPLGMAVAKGFKTVTEYLSVRREHPAYFLWRLRKQSQGYIFDA